MMQPDVTEHANPLADNETFEDTPSGAGLLAEAVRDAVERAGVWRAAENAERLAFAMSMWMLKHGHPDLTYLTVRIEYSNADRKLVLWIDDPGPVADSRDALDATPPEAEWRQSIGIRQLYVLVHRTKSGRTIRAALTVRYPYQNRLSWPAMGYTHPRQTFETFLTKDAARESAHRAAQMVREGTLTAVHTQGPDDADDMWHEVVCSDE